MFERVVKTKGAAHTHFQAIGVPKVCAPVRPCCCSYFLSLPPPSPHVTVAARLYLHTCWGEGVCLSSCAYFAPRFVQELAPRVVSELETESAKYDMTFKQVREGSGLECPATGVLSPASSRLLSTPPPSHSVVARRRPN